MITLSSRTGLFIAFICAVWAIGLIHVSVASNEGAFEAGRARNSSDESGVHQEIDVKKRRRNLKPDKGKAPFPERYIIKYKKEGGGTRRGATKLFSAKNMELLASSKIMSLKRSNMDVVMLKSKSEVLQLENDGNVEYVERGKTK